MAASTPLLAHIHRLLAPSAVDLGNDAELLQRFVRSRDQAAFAVLVARHGPMVLRLCRRVLGDVHAAEDACQAAFLVLVRKAHRLRDPETLSSWLHGVAYRLALKARAADVRRRQIETERLHSVPSPSAPDPLAEVSARELLAILDAELQRLPEKYRLPLILCCLEGRTQPEAARLLGWTPGSVKGRLERGREQLQQRLLRRGLTLPAALLALEATANTASARLPALLSAAILRAASPAETAGGIPAAVLALAEGSIGGMASAKGKLIAMLVLMLGLVTGGVGALVYPQLAAQPQKEREKAEAPTVREARQAKQLPRLDRYGDPLPPGALARLGTVRLRPAQTLALLVCLPDGKTVLSVGSSEDHTLIYLWDMNTGRLLRCFEPPFRIRVPGQAALSPDGKTLVVSGWSYEERRFRFILLDVPSGKQTSELKWSDPGLLAFAFSPDGKMLATAGQNQPIRLWDRASLTELRRCGEAGIDWTHLAFSSDGKLLASAGSEQTVQLWDVASGRKLRTLGGHSGRTTAAVFSPDGKLLATAGQDATIRLWEPATGKEVRDLRGKRGTSALAFSPDGTRLASGDARQDGDNMALSPVRLWDVTTGREEWHVAGHQYMVGSLGFSPDGKKLVSGTGGAVLHVWDVATGKDLLPFAEPQSFIDSVAFSPDGKTVAAGGLDGNIRLWEPASGRPSRVLDKGHPQWVWHVAFSSNGRSLVSYEHDGMARFWDVTAGHELRCLQTLGQGGAGSFDLSSDGQTMAVVGKDAIRLLDAANGKERWRIPRPSGYSTLLCFSPDGKTLASLDIEANSREKNAVLHLWDAATGEELRKWTTARVGRFAFSPDGQILVGIESDHLRKGAPQRSLHSWDIASVKHHAFVVTQPGRVFSLAYSPDGRMIAWGDAGGTISLCESATGQVRHRLRGHRSYVNSLSFAPDGKTLVSGSADTTVLLWDVTGRPVARSSALSLEQLPSLWTGLADKEAAKAFAAIGLLTAAPEQAVPFLKSHLRPAPELAEAQQVARLIAELDSNEFAVRDKAREHLRQLGERAEPGLSEALKNKLPLEARKRIEELLEGVRAAAVFPESLRNLRAVEVLEHIGTPQAREVLKTLADGAPTARLTQEAKAALERGRK